MLTETQAQEARSHEDDLHMEGVVVPYLGKAARARRRAAKTKLIRVAYALDKSEAAMSRFERGEVQPDDVDAVVLAYARELEINPLALWADALELARTEGVSHEHDEGTRPAARTATAGEAMERLGREAKAQRQPGQRRTAPKKRAS